ncbi:hypothetical protein HYS03_01735 [Candidatus Woesebacteria bacterium]|nr:hypothetical protein [Candidatus Woesebacteria bacterium]QQG47906.1 MAG: hypothetical protein HY044_02365 [Candidatus Woesebacteria bacterium]
MTNDSDFEAIIEGMLVVRDPKLDYIFFDKKFLKNISPISFDKNNLYIFSERKILLDKIFSKKDINVYKLSNNFEFGFRDFKKWSAGIYINKINEIIKKILPNDETPFGSLFSDFKNIHEKIVESPYKSKESYIATIVHEYAHIYYNRHKLWFLANKDENLKYINNSINYLMGEDSVLNGQIRFPYFGELHQFMSELFAYSVEYSASKIFWVNFLEDLKVSEINTLRIFAKKEKDKNLEKEDSVIVDDPHNFTKVFGRIIVDKYKKEWPDKLLNGFII